ncbi:MAG: hypothetical protein AWU58_842 [Methanohalophilus sp. T328-1]|jgi:hypothetical protein|uniref:hypothetical protein n=1 Tax=Methanohalophilus sp. DAL1 TaxID=1864608 RepID=UPI0007991C84|nr:hypothetical protein [Methanohalophilus sp. DAL1]KXS46067.1 MAG: hypothetical protein AWU58_842 [Methanohalophilus sp. T328-1]OBZ35183.1 MAG: hypothetical protein A9957_08500 [Methanohalophilus sp. DAL1]
MIKQEIYNNRPYIHRERILEKVKPINNEIKSKQVFEINNSNSFDIKNQRVKIDKRYKKRDVMLIVEKHDFKH